MSMSVLLFGFPAAVALTIGRSAPAGWPGIKPEPRAEVKSAVAIEAFLRDVVLGGRDALAAEREAFRRALAVNYPRAADAALRSIRDALGMA